MMWSHAIFRDSPIPQLILGPTGRIRMANPAAQALVGWHPLSGVALCDLIDPPDRPGMDAFVATLASLTPGAPRELGPVTIDWHGIQRRVELHGSRVQDGGEAPMTTVCLHEALAEPAVPDSEARDALTRVPGRGPGLAMLASAIGAEATGCLLVIDLDGFEDLNAEFGFDAGDEVLAEVSGRLRATVPPGTHLARIDGDMFLVVAAGVPLGQAPALAGRLLTTLVRPVQVDGTHKVVTASIGGAGLAMPTRDRALAAGLRALAVAKDRGGAQVVIDTPQQHVRGRRRKDLIQALKEAEAEKEVAQIEARTDPLTGLPNRRRFDEDRRMLQAQARATGQWVAAVYIDLDEFGAINRARGDDAGDHALAAVARIMQDQLRAEDTVYRKGGEEFVVLLTDADLRGAHGAAERLRMAVQDAQIPHGGTPDRPVVTISCGVAAGHGSWLDLWKLTRQANDAMRLAKRMGRNRTAITVGPAQALPEPLHEHAADPGEGGDSEPPAGPAQVRPSDETSDDAVEGEGA
jgi:diguanylate cyclase (GGDEF)-like protein